MKEVRFRLLAQPTARREDVEALTRAVRYFRIYSVAYDVAEPTKHNLRSVRYGSFIRDILNDPDHNLVTDLAHDRLFDSIREGLFPRSVIGIVLTGNGLYACEGGLRRELLGSGCFGSCAFISTRLIDSELSTDPSTLYLYRALQTQDRSKLIEFIAKHELGHVLRSKNGHCEDESCLMRPNKGDINRLFDNIARALDFCKICQSLISNGVNTLMLGALDNSSALDDL